MTQSEFIEATTRVENYFGKEYTSEQRKIMYENLKDWNKEKYVKAINYCIRNNKYLPKIADLTNKDIYTTTVQNKEKIEFVKCDKCNEGFVRYFKCIKNGDKILKYEYIALCTCENGKKQREINKYDLPTLAEVGIQGE